MFFLIPPLKGEGRLSEAKPGWGYPALARPPPGALHAPHSPLQGEG